MPDVITNCVATGGTATILKKHVDNRLDPLYQQYRGFHTGVDLKASEVYSICPGQVLYVGKDENAMCVIVRISSNVAILYKEFSKILVKMGDPVDLSQHLGTVPKFLHVDLLTQTKSSWPVRVRGLTFYKHDPTDVLQNGTSKYYQPSYGPTPIVVLDDGIPESMQEMLSNNKGDD